MRVVAAIACLMAVVLHSAGAAELLMYRTVGCPWCAAWDQAIGPVYPNTDVGRRVPLRMLYPEQTGSLDVILERPIRYSPTFVLVEGRREVGRIEGYPGEDFFWGLLDQLVSRLPNAGVDAAPNGQSRAAGQGRASQ